MDNEVKAPPKKRQEKVRLEKLDADTVRQVSRQSGIAVPYLLREAVSLLQAKYAKPLQ